MFCKKCHKKVVKVINTCNEFTNRCRCEGFFIEVTKKSEMKGVLNDAMAEKISGLKRRVTKDADMSFLRGIDKI